MEFNVPDRHQNRQRIPEYGIQALLKLHPFRSGRMGGRFVQGFSGPQHDLSDCLPLFWTASQQVRVSENGDTCYTFFVFQCADRTHAQASTIQSVWELMVGH